MGLFSKKPKSFTVKIQSTGDEIEVDSKTTILQAALDKGLAYPHRCRVGSCTSASTLKRTSFCISKLKSACRDSSSALARGSNDEPHTTHQSHAGGLGDVASLVMGAGASSHQSVKQAVAEALADAGIGTGAQGGELREAIDALRAALDAIERLQPDHKGPRGYPQSPGSDASDGGASRSGRRRSSAPKRRVRRGSSQESGTSTTFEV